MDNNNNWSGNLLNVLSILLGYENLMENRQQSADNDIERHNQKQAKQILDDLHEQFAYQNRLLEEILNILKGDDKDELF